MKKNKIVHADSVWYKVLHPADSLIIWCALNKLGWQQHKEDWRERRPMSGRALIRVKQNKTFIKHYFNKQYKPFIGFELILNTKTFRIIEHTSDWQVESLNKLNPDRFITKKTLMSFIQSFDEYAS